MTATTPGYLVTITAFLPADPQAPREMAIAAAMLDSLDEQLEAMGLQERIVTPRFVQRHKIQSPSAPAAPDPAEPTQPLDHAPAGPAAAGASDTSGPSQAAPFPAVPPPEDQAAGKDDGQPAAPCSHQRQKRYAGGVVACLDCQGVIGGEAA